MKNTGLLMLTLLFLTSNVFAVDGGAVLGGAIGGGTGAAIGSEIGGRNGAIIGGAIGGATGAAIGSQQKNEVAKPIKQEGKSDKYNQDERKDNGRHFGHYKEKHKNKNKNKHRDED